VRVSTESSVSSSASARASCLTSRSWMDSTSSAPAGRAGGAAGSAPSRSSGSSPCSSSSSSCRVSSMSSIGFALPHRFGRRIVLPVPDAATSPGQKGRNDAQRRSEGVPEPHGHGRRREIGEREPRGRMRTQETFGAAAPGRRVLYSASWVLRAPPPKRRRTAQATPGVRGLSNAHASRRVHLAPQAHGEDRQYPLERADLEGVDVVRDQVRVLPRLQAPLLVLLVREPGAAHRVEAEGLLS